MTAASRTADRAGRERPARVLRPGWWVYLAPEGIRAGRWVPVLATTHHRQHIGGPDLVRLDLPREQGRPSFVETTAGAPAFCLTPADARRAGLTTERTS